MCMFIVFVVVWLGGEMDGFLRFDGLLPTRKARLISRGKPSHSKQGNFHFDLGGDHNI